jgi:hypothetical protein
MGNMQRIELDRLLSAAESAEFDRIRAEMRAELPNLLAQAEDIAQAHMSWEDLDEVDQLIAFLKAERDRQGLSLQDVADRTGLKADDLLALEDGRNSSPALAVLTRYARVLGRRVILSLHMGEPFVAPATPAQSAS